MPGSTPASAAHAMSLPRTLVLSTLLAILPAACSTDGGGKAQPSAHEAFDSANT